MRELAQVRDAVIAALNDAGVEAMSMFPDHRAKRYTGPVAAIAVGTAEGRTIGFCNYLGEAYDEESGSVEEWYGKLLEGDVAVDIRAEKAADCEAGCETATEALMSGLPVGIRPGELRWDALTWEKATGMFLRRGTFRCQAVFVAKEQEDGETFLNFILKGVMQN